MSKHDETTRHYTIISGTGRAGTTLLVRILTRAGVDTGFLAESMQNDIDNTSHAGLEQDIRQRPQSAVVKSPWIATYSEEVLTAPDIVIDRAILCMRDLHDAAESRRSVQRKSRTTNEISGGLWGTRDPDAQEAVLADMFYGLVLSLTRHGVPITFLHFPRFATDAAYFVDMLSPVFPKTGRGSLRLAHQAEVLPQLISNFAEPSPAA